MKAPSRAAVAALATAAVLALTGCGSSDGTEPEAAPTRTATKDAAAKDATSSAAVQVVELDKYGISFEIPKGWTKIDKADVLTADSPMVKSFAEKLGQPAAQVASMMRSSMDVMAVTDQGMVSGFLENVNAVGVPGQRVNKGQLKLQLLSIGAKVGAVTEVESPVGTVVRAPYRLTTNGTTVNGTALAMNAGNAYVVITISAHGRAASDDRADQIQASLAKLR